MGVRTPFYFVICVDDQEPDLDPTPLPVMDADLYNYYYDEDDDEVDHDDGVYSIAASSCHDCKDDDEESLLDDIDSVYGEDDDECDFDLDYPSYSKSEILRQYMTSLKDEDYCNDYEDDEYSLPPEEWEETINDFRQEMDDATPRAGLVEKRQRRRYGRRETTSPPEVL